MVGDNKKQLPIRGWFGGYWLPTRPSRFISYSDRDFETLHYCRAIRPAGRGEGRTLRDLTDAVAAMRSNELVAFVALNVQRCEGLLNLATCLIVDAGCGPICKIENRPTRIETIDGAVLALVSVHRFEAWAKGRNCQAVVFDHSLRDPRLFALGKFQPATLRAQMAAAAFGVAVVAPGRFGGASIESLTRVDGEQ